MLFRQNPSPNENFGLRPVQSPFQSSGTSPDPIPLISLSSRTKHENSRVLSYAVRIVLHSTPNI